MTWINNISYIEVEVRLKVRIGKYNILTKGSLFDNEFVPKLFEIK